MKMLMSVFLGLASLGIAKLVQNSTVLVWLIGYWTGLFVYALLRKD